VARGGPQLLTRTTGMRRFIRYSAVGAVATAVHYLLLVMCVELVRWPAYAASGFGAVVGAQVAYAGNRWFTFAHLGGIGTSWLRFQGTALVGALLGMAVVAGAVQLGLHYLLAQMLATAASLLLTFVINRHWTFR
jgi:putative flippase GtrA